MKPNINMQVNIRALINIGDLENWQSSIFGRGKKLNKLVDSVFWKLQKDLELSEYKLADYIGVSRNSVRKWRNGPLHPVPLPLFNKLKNYVDENEFLFAIEQLKTYQNSEWLRIPKKLTKDLSEILGRHVGDGSITRRTYTIKLVTNNKKFAMIHAKDLEKLFGIKPKILKAKDRNYWEVKINSRALSAVLNTVFEQPLGRKSGIAKEPMIIKNAGINFEKTFLRGIADTDGSIWKTKSGSMSFEIGSKSRELIKDCSRILEKVGFSTYTIKQKKKGYNRLRISDYDVLKFSKIIGFKNPDKIYRLQWPKAG